jgi:hypothetical protein
VTFRNSILAGNTLIRQAIQSQNFATGSTGWAIKKDGSAEFNNVLVRGTVFVKDTNGNYVKLWIDPGGDAIAEFGTALSATPFNLPGDVLSYTAGSGATARQGLQMDGPVTATNSTGGTWGATMSMVSGYGNNNIVAQQCFWDFYFQRHLVGAASINFLHLSPTACQYVGDADAIDPTSTGSADTVIEETWKTATLVNSWATSSGGGPRPGFFYKRLATNMVANDGIIQKTTGVINGEQIATINTSYIPPESRFWAVGMDVNSSGSLQFAMLEIAGVNQGASAGNVYYFGPAVGAGNTARIFIGGQWPYKD